MLDSVQSTTASASTPFNIQCNHDEDEGDEKIKKQRDHGVFKQLPRYAKVPRVDFTFSSLVLTLNSYSF